MEWLNKVDHVRNASVSGHDQSEENNLLRKINGEFSERDWQQIKQDLYQSYLYHTDEDQVWVLRNLTTREYVRSDQLDLPSNSVLRDSPQVKETRLISSKLRKIWKAVKGEKERPLLVLTCYLGIDVHIVHDEQYSIFNEAPWLSHAFDLVTLEEHTFSIEEEEEEEEEEGRRRRRRRRRRRSTSRTIFLNQ